MSVARLSARVRANRANAAKSTGPRTQEGKERVRRNALIHGLASAQLPTVSGDIELFVEALLRNTGVIQTPAMEAAARDLVDAQLHVLAVRALRRGYWLRLSVLDPARVGQHEPVAKTPAPYGFRKLARLIEAEARGAARRNEPLKNIEALERYERRALARRKWASRVFSDLVAEAMAVNRAVR